MPSEAIATDGVRLLQGGAMSTAMVAASHVHVCWVVGDARGQDLHRESTGEVGTWACCCRNMTAAEGHEN